MNNKILFYTFQRICQVKMMDMAPKRQESKQKRMQTLACILFFGIL